ncbi:hypothetical protein DFH06DRAFT_1351231 [Mycena polygramma]|nr:hypothetical protein DFH06DRAFT_1351231 [Mycena polygramma]
MGTRECGTWRIFGYAEYGARAARRFDKTIPADIYSSGNSLFIYSTPRAAGDFDSASGLVLDAIYDTWVIRDSCDQRTKEIWPYLLHGPGAAPSLQRDEPVDFAAC